MRIYCTLLFCLLLSGAMPVSAGASKLDQSMALAHKLLNSQGCKACHSFGGEGGKSALSLEAAGKKLSAEEIRAQLSNPGRRHGNEQIRDFGHLSPAELDALVKLIKKPRTASEVRK